MEYRNDIQYFIKGDSIIKIDADNFPDTESSEFIYEVFKIKNGRALFLEKHLQRLNKSLEIKSLLKIDINDYSAKVEALLDANNRVEGNVKIVISFDENNIAVPIFYYIPHHYPTSNQYEKGVKLVLQNAVRNTPQAKISNLKIRKNANRIISDLDIYETLLVNKANQITEGSRSNVFFISGNELITAPDNMVLLGITRDKVLQLAKNLNISIRSEALNIDKLKNIDAAFLTATSPGILQIQSIEGYNYEVNNNIYIKLFESFYQ